MFAHKPIYVATAGENFTSKTGSMTLIVEAFFQSVCRAFKFVDELVDLIFEIRSVHRTMIEVGVEVALESIRVVFHAL